MTALAEKTAEFVIARQFDAPRDAVWKAFTEADHAKQWFGPKGVTVTTARMDARPGGMFHFGMQTPDGGMIWGKLAFRELVRPERLVWVHSFSDEAGGLTRHPLSPTWPLELLTTVTLEEAGAGKTDLTLRWSALNASAEEQRTFDVAHAEMRIGWGGAFDQLDVHLANAK